MADIFLSYARADKVHAERLASALGAAGYAVWWDSHIRGGKDFDPVIESELNAASCVVVL